MNESLKKNSLPVIITDACSCCSKKAVDLIDLPQYPITEFYTDNLASNNLYGFYDQKVLFCEDCAHLFLSTIIDPDIIYNNYITSTNKSNGAVECLKNFKSYILSSINLNNYSSIIDIGGNDSTFLSFFAGDIENLINIDINATAKSDNIILHKSSWEDVDFNQHNSQKPKIFTSSHTIEHLDSPIPFLEKISKSMKANDVFYLQFPSLELLVKEQRYDQLCHQHLNIFSLKSIGIALNQCNLYINSYEFDSNHFGTLRLKISKIKNKILDFEIISKSSILHSYEDFQNFYLKFGDSYKKILTDGQGFGAGLMVPTLAYNLPIINNLQVIYDQDRSKINKRFINLRPEIKDSKYMDITKPIIITAISTKAATRSIFNYLSSNKFKKILIPTITT